ncbi:hypothetical protein NDA18_004776 [Ustilago nuda]|nr:hypothetical protein NDA18_004776 [Ustilago nuda]
MAHDQDADSLFDDECDPFQEARVVQNPPSNYAIPVASPSAPDIPGLYFFPHLLSRELHDQTLQQVAACNYFALEDNEEAATSEADHSSHGTAYRRSPRNQAMLFARSLPWSTERAASQQNQQPDVSATKEDPPGCFGLPLWSVNLIERLRQLLTSLPHEKLPQKIKDLLFPAGQSLSRQLILNLYGGTEGLASHVDLVNRFADGILLCSFGPQGTGIVMDFTHDSFATQHLFLPSGSVLLLSGEARYNWKHGIAARSFDLVRSSHFPGRVDTLNRSIRLSITIRSMLPGADVVGE